MLNGRSPKLYCIIIAVMLTFGVGILLTNCSDDPVASEDEPEIIYDMYVDVENGSDSNSGSKINPFKTITHAFSVAYKHDTIKVMPGTYNEASGEDFPIYFPDSVLLIGDISNKGTAEGDSTKIAGYGVYNASDFATFVGSDGSKIVGVYVFQPSELTSHYCVASENDDFIIEKNTFSSQYGCMLLMGDGTVQVMDNVFINSVRYGIRSSGTGSVFIENNHFSDCIYNIYNQFGDAEIINNTFAGDAFVAISLGYDGNALIDGNSIAGSYDNSAISIGNNYSATLRNNTFNVTSGPCIMIGGNYARDLGTDVDNGGNYFGGASGVAISMETDAVITAIGNTWYNSPPVCGTEIIIVGDGKVAYGSGIADTCYGAK